MVELVKPRLVGNSQSGPQASDQRVTPPSTSAGKQNAMRNKASSPMQLLASVRLIGDENVWSRWHRGHHHPV